MSRNQIERTLEAPAVTMKADVTVAIPIGTAVVVNADYQVGLPADQNTFTQGVTLKAHASGVYECIPVLFPGPVIRVTLGADAMTAGMLVNGDQTTPGEWIQDTDDPAGFLLEGGDDGDLADMVYVGEQY